MVKKYGSIDSFTLIEIMVVVVIISISLTIFIPKVSTGIESAKFRDGITEVIAFLRKAHLDAIKGREDIEVTINFKENNLKRDDDQLYTLPSDIILKPEDSGSYNNTKFSFFYNGRGAGPEIQLIGQNERTAIVYIDMLSGLAKCDLR